MFRVFINPGHDREYDSGAVNALTGLRECDVAYNIGAMAQHYLLAVGYATKVFQSDFLGYTTHADRPEEICDVANTWGADVAVSIHCNAFNEAAHGTETHVYALGGASERLARAIQDQIVNSLYTLNRGIKISPKFRFLNATAMPAVLVETAFIDNPHDLSLLTYKQDDFARAIARGVTDFFTREYSS